MALNKPHNMTKGMNLTILSIPSSWGLTFGAINHHYDLIIKGHVLIIIGIEKSMVIVLLVKDNK